MIELKVGQIIKVVEERGCRNCAFNTQGQCLINIPCSKLSRQDGKDVIFKIVGEV